MSELAFAFVYYSGMTGPDMLGASGTKRQISTTSPWKA